MRKSPDKMQAQCVCVCINLETILSCKFQMTQVICSFFKDFVLFCFNYALWCKGNIIKMPMNQKLNPFGLQWLKAKTHH